MQYNFLKKCIKEGHFFFTLNGVYLDENVLNFELFPVAYLLQFFLWSFFHPLFLLYFLIKYIYMNDKRKISDLF